MPFTKNDENYLAFGTEDGQYDRSPEVIWSSDVKPQRQVWRSSSPRLPPNRKHNLLHSFLIVSIFTKFHHSPAEPITFTVIVAHVTRPCFTLDQMLPSTE